MTKRQQVVAWIAMIGGGIAYFFVQFKLTEMMR
jgi:hypothetical protein